MNIIDQLDGMRLTFEHKPHFETLEVRACFVQTPDVVHLQAFNLAAMEQENRFLAFVIRECRRGLGRRQQMQHLRNENVPMTDPKLPQTVITCHYDAAENCYRITAECQEHELAVQLVSKALVVSNVHYLVSKAAKILQELIDERGAES